MQKGHARLLDYFLYFLISAAAISGFLAAMAWRVPEAEFLRRFVLCSATLAMLGLHLEYDKAVWVSVRTGSLAARS